MCRYIEYESTLAELLQLRKVKLGIKEETKGEMSIVKRCHTVFDRATRKFRGDLRLWLGWLEYCKASNSTRQMSKVSTSGRAPLATLYKRKRPLPIECQSHTLMPCVKQGLRLDSWVRKT